MADTIKITSERLLMVEGWDDVRFVERLITNLEIEAGLFQVINYEGVTNLRTVLNTIKLTTNNFDTVTHVCVLRDMDFEGNPFASIIDALVANNMPAPQAAGAIATGDVTVGIFLFPDNSSKGMLEDLCLQAFSGDIILTCIEDYLSCLSDNKMEFVESALPKTKLNTLISTKSLDKSIRKNDRRVWGLDYAVSKRWFPWDNPAFDNIKAFLQQLAQ